MGSLLKNVFIMFALFILAIATAEAIEPADIEGNLPFEDSRDYEDTIRANDSIENDVEDTNEKISPISRAPAIIGNDHFADYDMPLDQQVQDDATNYNSENFEDNLEDQNYEDSSIEY
jgi:hypothetical protein